MMDGISVLIVCLVAMIIGRVYEYLKWKPKYDDAESYSRSLFVVRSSLLEEVEELNYKINDLKAEQRSKAVEMNQLLTEISQVTGIEVVQLPSFGTVYLNQDKIQREAMLSLNMEDET